MKTNLGRLVGILVGGLLIVLSAGCEMNTDSPYAEKRTRAKLAPQSPAVVEKESREDWSEVKDRANELETRVDELEEELR